MDVKLSIVIPTKNREEELIDCINSIRGQTSLPNEVLVIDDGQISQRARDFISDLLFQTDISLKYFRKEKPGLAESRNLGARNAVGDVVLFLDDDVGLEKNYISKLVEVWEANKDDKELAGISGIATNTNDKSLLEKVFDRVFCLYSPKPWSILPWGFQNWDYDLKHKQKVQWVPCGFTSFRREILQEYQFEPLQPGRTALEDIEFCWKLNKDGYHFIITPFARLVHHESATGREKAFLSGYKEGFNRCLIFKMHAQKTFKNYVCFSIASLGWIIRQWLAAIAEPRLALSHLLLSFGLIKGNFSFLLKSWRER